MDKQKTKQTVKIIALIYISLHIVLFVTQKSLIYQPRKAEKVDTKEYSVVEIRENLSSLYKAPQNDQKPIIVYFHGNAGNAYDRIHKLGRLANYGYGILLAEYSGYGFNNGSPKETVLYQNANDNMNWILKKNENPIIIYGESLGTGIAIDYLSRNSSDRVKALILETPYDSMQTVAQNSYPFILGTQFLLTEKYDSRSKIDKIDIPTLYLLAEKDEVVSYKSGETLFNADHHPKTKHVFSKASHNTIYNFKPESVIFEFIDTHNKKI